MSDIQHAHLYGMREAKYDWLSTHDVNSTDWTKVEPQKPFSLFTPQDNRLLPEYEKGWKISDAMPVNSTGVKTHRDHFVLDFDKDSLQSRIIEFRNLKIPDQEILDKYNLESKSDWNITNKRKALVNDLEWESYFTKCLYRPFDVRNYYHHEYLVDRPRNEVSQHFLSKENISLMWIRPLSPSYEFSVLAGKNIPHQCVVGNKTAGAGASYFAPIYIYPDIEKPQELQENLRPNFSDEFLTEITNKLGYTPTPEAIFYYIYAIFHSPTYRTRYAEFLKIDFPRVPLTSDDQLFRKLGEYGEELVALHLMKSSKLDQHLTQIIDKGGEFVVDAGHPKYTDGEVIINKKGDRFTGVPKSVWEFYVGGYQVCHKWLKDRKGRQLSPEDLNHYQKIIVALSETMQIMTAIDAAIPSFPIE